MKILLISNLYPSKKYPYYGTFIKNIYELLNEYYMVDLVYITKQENNIKKLVAYIIFYLKVIILGIFRNYDCIYAHYISHCEFPVRIIRLFKKKVKIVGNVHGEDVFSEFKEYKKNYIYAKRFMKVSDYIIVPSEYFKHKISKEYKYSEEKIFTSPSGGVNTNIFFPDNKFMCRQYLSLQKEKFYLGFVSRIEKGKGWDLLLKAVSQIIYESKINNLELIIVGSGSEVEKLREYIKQLEIDKYIRLFTMVSQKELHYIYNSLDVFIFPTRIIAESLGLVGLEAMACKIPCIIANTEGPLSYAKNDINSIIFDKNSENDLEKKILYFYNMSIKKRMQIIEAGYKTAQNFSRDKVQSGLIDFFENLNGDKYGQYSVGRRTSI